MSSTPATRPPTIVALRNFMVGTPSFSWCLVAKEMVGSTLSRESGRGPDVRVHAEQVGRVVFLLERGEPSPVWAVVVVHGLLISGIEVDVETAGEMADLVPGGMDPGAIGLIVGSVLPAGRHQQLKLLAPVRERCRSRRHVADGAAAMLQDDAQSSIGLDLVDERVNEHRGQFRH